jgi:hypothetical protein
MYQKSICPKVNVSKVNVSKRPCVKSQGTQNVSFLKTQFFIQTNYKKQVYMIEYVYAMAKTEIIHPKNVGASVAMNFT